MWGHDLSQLPEDDALPLSGAPRWAHCIHYLKVPGINHILDIDCVADAR